jgi:hypothetical protein
MFERFTDRARRSVVLAQEESRRLRHGHIGPEHVLLGIIDAGGSPGATALAENGFDLEQTRARLVPGPPDAGVGPGHIPFTPQAKRTLQLALQEALQLKHNYIGAEHLVLGMLALDDFDLEALAPAGFDRAALRAAVLRAIEATPTPPRPESPSWTRGNAADPALRDLAARLQNVRRAKDEAIDARDFDTAARRREEEVALLAEQSNAFARHLGTAPSTMVRGRVFVTYRPADEGVAGRLYDALVTALTPSMVAMDAGPARSDLDPMEAVMAAVASSEYLVVVIGPSWVDSRTADGRPRIEQVDDEVRVSLLAAQGGQQVVPVLVGGAPQPALEELPPAAAALARLEPVRLGHLTFLSDLNHLLTRLGRNAEAA